MFHLAKESERSPAAGRRVCRRPSNNLEVVANSQLELPVRADRSGRAAAGGRSGGVSADHIIHAGYVTVVQQIEHLEAPFQGMTFSHTEPLAQVRVQVHVTETTEGIPAQQARAVAGSAVAITIRVGPDAARIWETRNGAEPASKAAPHRQVQEAVKSEVVTTLLIGQSAVELHIGGIHVQRISLTEIVRIADRFGPGVIGLDCEVVAHALRESHLQGIVKAGVSGVLEKEPPVASKVDPQGTGNDGGHAEWPLRVRL